MHHHAFNQRSILDLLWVSWALGRDSNKCFLNPDTWAIQVLSCSFTSMSTLHISEQNCVGMPQPLSIGIVN